MEFLDSLDFQTKKKTNRVRSWYLYEQFKSLENSQLEAAKKLKNRCYQDRILRRELSERKVRRSLYDQCKSTDTCSIKSTETRTSLYASNDNFFEGCSQLEDEQSDRDEHGVRDEHSEIEIADHEAIIQHDSGFEHSSVFKSIADLDNSIASAVENLNDSENVTDEIKEELEYVKHGIAKNITLQLEAAKENVQCLEQFSDFCDYEKSSYKESEQPNSKNEKTKSAVIPKNSQNNSLYDNNVIAAWMKLVSFAYQVIKLNHAWMKLVSFAYQVIELNYGGNCYCDCSSQVMTAVLACDVLRRGITRMCDILQPYVCPIKLSNDETISLNCYKNVKRKNEIIQKSNHKPLSHQLYNQENEKKSTCKRCFNRKYNLDNLTKYDAYTYKNRIASEPIPDVARKIVSRGGSDNTRSTLWPSEFWSEQHSHRNCPCCAKTNPMLKLTKYLDDILVHMDC